MFEGLGCFPDMCKIKLKNDAVPRSVPSRRMPLKIKDKLKKTLELLTEKNIIIPIDEPADWVNNIVIVEKTDGSLRVCIDPSELNKHIVRENFIRFYRSKK